MNDVKEIHHELAQVLKRKKIKEPSLYVYKYYQWFALEFRFPATGRSFCTWWEQKFKTKEDAILWLTRTETD